MVKTVLLLTFIIVPESKTIGNVTSNLRQNSKSNHTRW